MLNITPIADRVLVEPEVAASKTASGLFIPEGAKEKPKRGTIVAVGPGKKDEPMNLKVGDVILYGKFSGMEVEHEGKEYLIMKEYDIFAVVNR